MTITVKKDNNNNLLFNVNMKGMTMGKLCALENALKVHSTELSQEILLGLQKAMKKESD
jgi:hypothetical protein